MLIEVLMFNYLVHQSASYSLDSEINGVTVEHLTLVIHCLHMMQICCPHQGLLRCCHVELVGPSDPKYWLSGGEGPTKSRRNKQNKLTNRDC